MRGAHGLVDGCDDIWVTLEVSRGSKGIPTMRALRLEVEHVSISQRCKAMLITAICEERQ